MSSGGVARLKEVVKRQVAASMFLNISMETSDEMSVKEFELVERVAKEIQDELKNESSSPMRPGTMGKARIL